MSFKNLALAALLAASMTATANAFCSAPQITHAPTRLPASNVDLDGKEYWLEEFKTADGEILNPYSVLKVKREADISQIKNAYREMSKRFHPDKQRFRDIMPGSCNDLDDVRDEWERIKLSYEILRNPKTRKRFDRHEVLADPGGAVTRAVTDAALGAVGKGLAGVGSGLFAGVAFAFDKLAGDEDKPRP